MSLRPEFSLVPAEFNRFLFAAIGEDKNGTPLTVLSALARLGIDPWWEADRLSGLPKETAARALAKAIAALPEGDWEVSDSWAIASRLVDQLPTRRAPSVQSPRIESNKNERRKSGAAAWLIWLVVLALVVFATSHLLADRASEPFPSPPSSMQR